MSFGDIITLLEAHPVVTGLVVVVVGGLFKWMWTRIFGGKGKVAEGSALVQSHSGTGDNIGRDKVITH
ncbi:MAG: hypothetical protein ACO2YO_13920, partial [Paracoccaceae bacterium]